MPEAQEVDFRGTWFVLPTAFEEDGRLDADGQRQVVEAAISWGVDGLVTLGVMGEAPSLTEEERSEVLRTVVQGAAGRVPVAAGCSGPSSPVVAHRIREAAGQGASAVMISAPPLARDADAVPGFFERAKEASPVPIILQDEPVTTGTILSVSLLLRCIEACGASAVKLEDPPTPPKIRALLAVRPELRLFGALGGVAALSELRRGACGTMSGFAYPEVLAAVRIRVEAGDPNGAASIFDRYLPLIAFEGQLIVGLGIRKELLRRRGAIPRATTRGAPQPDAETLAELDDVLRRVGLAPSPERLEVR
jgi:4-hydroxy-tetrahydrodipicolinate synthase